MGAAFKQILAFTGLFIAVLPALVGCRKEAVFSVPWHHLSSLPNANVHMTTITIEGLAEAYNPSMVAFDKGYLLAFRHDSNRFVFNKADDRANQQSHIGLVFLNKHFDIISGVTNFKPRRALLPTYPGSQTEDPRLFEWQGGIYLLYNDSLDGTQAGLRKLFLAEVLINPQGGRPQLEVGRERRIVYKYERGFEKNWTPVVAGNKLYFIYTFHPLRLLQVDEVQDDEEILTVSDVKETLPSELGELSWNYGSLSGGTPAVADPLAGQHSYVTFFHSYVLEPSHRGYRRKYFAGIGRFDFIRNCPLGESLKFTGISKKPLYHADFYKDENPVTGMQVVFPGGLVVEPERYVVSLGLHDHSMVILEMPRTEVRQFLTP